MEAEEPPRRIRHRNHTDDYTQRYSIQQRKHSDTSRSFRPRPSDPAPSSPNPAERSGYSGSRSRPPAKPGVVSIAGREEFHRTRSSDHSHARNSKRSAPESRTLFDPRRDDPVKFRGSSTNSQSAASVSSLTSREPSEFSLSLSSTSRTSSKQSPIVEKLRKDYRIIQDLESRVCVDSRIPIDDAEWVRIVNRHKELAELYLQFLIFTLSPNNPKSFRSIPSRYHIQEKIWLKAIHLLLERLRHALTQLSNRRLSEDAPDVYGHVTDFIYWAYTFYTAMLEEPYLTTCRDLCLEQLGDLARYRMAIAGLAAKLDIGESPLRRQPSAQALSTGKKDRLDLQSGRNASASLNSSRAHLPSIGEAALPFLEDRDEQELWRSVALEWYEKALSATPGHGKIHHCLALINRSRGTDELRALYHYVRSLIVYRPYESSAESIVSVFRFEGDYSVPEERPGKGGIAKNRIRPGATLNELFVHLHSMIFSKVDLDKFDAVLERFFEQLRIQLPHSSFANTSNEASGTNSGNQIDHSEVPQLNDVTMIYMAVINIAGLLQYGSKEGEIAKVSLPLEDPQNNIFSLQQMSSKLPTVDESPEPVNRTTEQSANTDSNNISDTEPELDGDFEDKTENKDQHRAKSESITNHHLINLKQVKNPVDIENERARNMMTFNAAQKLAFGMLDQIIRFQRQNDTCSASVIASPYVTLLVTFITTVATSIGSNLSNESSFSTDNGEGEQPNGKERQQPLQSGRGTPSKKTNPSTPDTSVIALLERQIPWKALEMLFDDIATHHPILKSIDSSDEKGSNSSGFTLGRIIGTPLPEDYCIRSCEWVRRLFGKGFWKARTKKRNPRDGTLEGEQKDPLGIRIQGLISTEIDVIQDNVDCLYQVLNESLRELENARWRRISFMISRLAQNVPELEIKSTKVILSESIKSKISKWEQEETDARQKQIEIEQLALNKRWERMHEDAESTGHDLEDEDEEEDEEDEDNEEDDEIVRQLKRRRREIRNEMKQLRKYKQHMSLQKSPRRKGNISKKHIPNLVAGYTNLVFDTNVLVSHLDIFRRVIESQNWTVIIPLAVVTELDGLCKKEKLKDAAEEAISYLKQSMVKFRKNLKIQTSHGNYLSNLSVRSENIDFDVARSMDDVILNAAVWRSQNMSQPDPSQNKRAPSVALVSFDRNLRIKARVHNLEVVSNVNQIPGVRSPSRTLRDGMG